MVGTTPFYAALARDRTRYFCGPGPGSRGPVSALPTQLPLL